MRKNLTAFFAIVFSVLTQEISAQSKASGIITDSEFGEPLIGATILEKGTTTTNGTITDVDGNFDLLLQSTDAVLIISYAGYRTTEIKAGTDLSIRLEFDNIELDEVVVIGYGSQKKSDVTGSVSGIKSKTLMESQTTDVFSAMQGRVAGVQISTDSGQPGSGMNFVVRGQTSVNGSSSPLFVIDGVQIDVNFDEVATTGSSQSRMNPLTGINPADIESIEVLKDASATAIFGSRGANGVVIVTTKSGKDGRSNVDYTFNFSASEAIKEMPVLSPEDYLTYQEQINNTQFLNNGITNERRNFDELESFNYQDEGLRTAITMQHQLSLRGSGGKSNYAAGIGYLQQEGIVVNNDYEQYNMRLRINNDVNDKLTLRFSSNASYSVVGGVANSGGPDSFTGVTQQLLLANPWNIQSEDIDPFTDEFISPLDLIQNSDKTTKLFRMFVNTGADYQITDDLKYSAFIGGNLSNSKAKEFYSSETSWGRNSNGEARLREVNTFSFNHSSQLHFNKTINTNHKIDAMGAFEVFQYNWEDFRNTIGNFEDETTGVNDISKGTTLSNYSTNRNRTKRLSYLSRVNYTLFGKYLITASIRADGSDKFGPGNKWGYFPSGAIAWRVSEESFLAGVKSISDLKLRLSYGASGNERIPPYTYLAQLDPTYYASNDAITFGLAPASIENPNLKWEVTDQINAGLDLGLIEGRVNFTFDYYKKITRDLLLDAPIPSQSGFNSQFQNIGRIDNEGLEFQVTTVNIDKNNFRWKTDFNITFNRNKVVDLGEAEFIPVTTFGGWQTDIARVIVGQPIGTMFGYEYAGVYQIEDFTWQSNSDPTVAHEDRDYVLKESQPVYESGNARPGAMKYTDINGDEVINDDDRKVIGQSNPVHFGGINNTFSYKNFDLSVFFQWTYGNDLYNAGKLRLNGNRVWSNISQDYFENHWTPENPENEYPAYGSVDQNVPSSYFVEDGSFLRLKTISLGFIVPKRMTNKMGISRMKFNLIGNNLLTWTNYTGWDPEVNYRDPLISGLDRIAYPRARSYTFSVNVTF